MKTNKVIFTQINIIFTIAAILVFIVSMCFLIPQKEPAKPKTLADFIADNITSHPSDWKFIENKSENERDYYFGADTLLNAKCNIKVIYFHYGSSGGTKVITTDTVVLKDNESVVIAKAYDKAIYEPIRLKEVANAKAKADNAEKIRQNKMKQMAETLCK